jgi:hypothetical protein
MDSVLQILAAEFELLKNETAAGYRASGMAVSGNWAQELEVHVSSSGALLSAPGYINGRGPGTPPPSEAIEQWIKAKGIAAQLEKDLAISSLAYLIAKKIGRVGWQPKPGANSFIETIITPERIQQIVDKLGESYIQEFTSDIINFLKLATA